MSPSKSRRPGGKYYLYYVSQARLQRREPDAMRPIPASIVEDLIRDRLRRMIGAVKPVGHRRAETQADMSDATLHELVRQLVLRVNVCAGNVSIVLNPTAIASRTGLGLKQTSKELRVRLPVEDRIDADGETLVLTIPVCLWVRGGIKRVEGWDKPDWTTAKPRHDPTLIKALVRAHQWREWIERGEVLNLEGLSERTGHDRKYAHATLKLAFLAPDIQRAILTGRQPKALTLSVLSDGDLPMLWADQRTLLRVASPADPTFRQSGV